MNKRRYYTGVGIRETPFEIYLVMKACAMVFEKKGYILRSGTALGADSAFEQGITNPDNAEIYIPYKSFPQKMWKENSAINYIIPSENKDKYFQANNLLMRNNLYKRWETVKQEWVMKLHNRNIFQVLGQNLNKKEKSMFCLCYTSCGSTTYEQTDPNRTGGTGTAINTSSFFDVPVFNLAKENHLNRIVNFLKDNRELIDFDRIFNTVPCSSFFNQESNKQTVSSLITKTSPKIFNEVNFPEIKNINSSKNNISSNSRYVV